MFDREINGPGFPRIPDITAAQKLGYIQDGFWDARLSQMLDIYTVVDGADVVPAETTGQDYFVDSASKADDMPMEFQMLIVITAGFRLLRLKIMDLAVNFTAEAGPVSFEQQASATVLRALLNNLQGRLQELKTQYSDGFSGSFNYWDGVAQAAASEYAQLQELTALV
jgi:hypothetical protein